MKAERYLAAHPTNPDAVLVAAARRYAAAVVAHNRAGAGRIELESLLERESAEHDLIVAAGYQCPYCDPLEVCPGRIVDTRPL